jgi:hypothetical protein
MRETGTSPGGRLNELHKSYLVMLVESYPDIKLMDGYDDCIMGVCHRYGQEPIIAYDLSKVLDKLVADGMTMEEAREFHEFNQIGAWVGDHTPCFIQRGVN